MAIFDLQPLPEETIEELGLSPSDLWLISIEEKTYGPFETHSLKHYFSEHEELKKIALVSHPESLEWTPFSAVKEFKPVEVVTPTATPKDPRYWMMVEGSLSKPMKFAKVEALLADGELIMTDHLSTDDGETWQKVSKIKEFAHHFHTGNELPTPPSEESFQNARVFVLEKLAARAIEYPNHFTPPSPNMGPAEGKPLTKLEEFSVPKVKRVHVSPSLRWAAPMAMMFLLAVSAGGYYFFTPSSDPVVAEVEEQTPSQKRRSLAASRRAETPRQPASYRPLNTAAEARPSYQEASYQQPDYPTHIETHDHNQDMNDPLMDSMVDSPAPEEHSLVAPQASAEESLDAAMNGIAAPQPDLESPIVESSDL